MYVCEACNYFINLSVALPSHLVKRRNFCGNCGRVCSSFTITFCKTNFGINVQNSMNFTIVIQIEYCVRFYRLMLHRSADFTNVTCIYLYDLDH